MSLSVYHRLRKLSFIVLTVASASSVSLIGGLGLEAVQEQILPIVPLLIALPALNTMVGDYAAIIAAHVSDPTEQTGDKKVLIRAIGKAIWVNVVGVLVLSLVLALRRGYLFEAGFIIKFVLFITFALLSIIGLMFIITLLLEKLLEKRRLNPDDILIPVVTSITDVLMLGLIALSVGLIF